MGFFLSKMAVETTGVEDKDIIKPDSDDLFTLIASLSIEDDVFSFPCSGASFGTGLPLDSNVLGDTFNFYGLPWNRAVDDSIRKIWRRRESASGRDPVFTMKEEKLLSSGRWQCWDFWEIMPLQRIQEENFQLFSYWNSGTVTPAATTQSDSHCSPNKFQINTDTEDQSKTVHEIIEKTQRSLALFTAEYFHVYKEKALPIVDKEIVFFVERIRPWKMHYDLKFEPVVNIHLMRPDKSRERLLLRLPLPHDSLGRYFFSFCPTETGCHVVSVTVTVGSISSHGFVTRHIPGSPIEIEPSRCYSNSNGYNFIITELGFNSPFFGDAWGAAVYRPRNWIYVADRMANQVVVLDVNPSVQKIVKKFGGRGSGPGEFLRPTGIDVDHVHKRVIVSDKSNHRISVFELEGGFLFSFGRKGTENGEFRYPWGVAASPDGDIIAVADSRNSRIQFFDARGNYLRKYPNVEPELEHKGEIKFPRGLAFSSDGNYIYVTDFSTHATYVLNLDLTQIEVFMAAGSSCHLEGITVDDAGNVLIADSKNDCIYIFSSSGVHVWTMTGSGVDWFDKPVDGAVLSGGMVAVVDKASRVRIF